MDVIHLYILANMLMVINMQEYYYDQRGDTRCRCRACHKIDPTVLNVHLVPHSHNDVGWLKTVEQYYWGLNTNIQKASVNSIYESVLTALLQNPERRYICVETAYFYKWWTYASNDRKAQFKKLVESGQIEIVGGGWTMNDEATTNYQEVIDQFTLGLRVINDTLGLCGHPKVIWQIDPFGHSREMASIFSQIGFDAVILGRIDFKDKLARLLTNTLEVLWDGSDSLGDNSNIFTSTLYDAYRSPHGFCFDILCEDDDIVSNPNSPECNARDKSFEFAELVRLLAQYYTTKNILIPMGGDFHYQEALSSFRNLDALIEGFKAYNHTFKETPINVFYSTPSCYIKAVNAEAQARKISYRVKSDDFFPYSSDYNSYWTGYFTSRPTSKRFVREGNNLLQIVKQLTTYVEKPEKFSKEFLPLQQVMAVMQHHDAMTGTEKQHVADDYHKMLSDAIKSSVRTAKDVLTALLPLNSANAVSIDLTSCLATNVSVCSVSQNNDFLIAIYNPLSRVVSHYVRLPISHGCFYIVGEDGITEHAMRYEIFPTISDFAYLEGHKPAEYDLVFSATDIPPLGLKIYKVQRNQNFCQRCINLDNSRSRFSIGTNVNGFQLDATTGLLRTMTIMGVTIKVEQEFLFYSSATGYNSVAAHRASGAYIFRPQPTHPNAIPLAKSVKTTTYKGLLVEEVHQTVNPWIKQIIRLYKLSNHIEFDWLVGPIDVDIQGKEIITRFTTELCSGDIFYTDANGRQMMKRVRNFRPTYKYTDSEQVAGNYYPVTSKIVIKDLEGSTEFAVLTDRSQGGTSLASGQLELMVHRRLFHDDGFGVNEPLNERQFGQGTVVRGRHYVTFGPTTTPTINCESNTVVQKNIAQEKVMACWSFLIPNLNLWPLIHKELSGLMYALPRNIRLLTLEPWRASQSTILLRLEHIFEDDEHPDLSMPVTLTLKGMFTFFKVISATEMTLAANVELENSSRLKWKLGSSLENPIEDYDSRYVEYSMRPPLDKDFIVELTPMEIRTFILTVVYT